MRFVLSLIASLFFASAASAESIGVFVAASGEVKILRAENYLAAAPGVEVLSNDIVETEKGASAQLDMEDGSVLKLGPETRLALSNYELDADRNVVSATLDVLSGWLRFAVAKLKPDRRYNFNTPMLTIGVRGTEGTIEAENEQGGLHLQEGAVDVTPFGQDITRFQPVRVVSGEYIQRLRGQQLAKLPKPPGAFQRRLPPTVQQPLVRRAQELKQRGVPPKVIRRITRDDAKRIIQRHPHLKEKLRERFKPLDIKTPLGPGGPKERGIAPTRLEPDDAKARPGFGSQILRQRQLKGDGPRDPDEAAEKLRERMKQRQEQGKTVDPRLRKKLQEEELQLRSLPPPPKPDLSTPRKVMPSPTPPPTSPPPTDKPTLPSPGATSPTQLQPTDRLLLQKPPDTTQETLPTIKSTEPLQQQTAPLLQQRLQPATTR